MWTIRCYWYLVKSYVLSAIEMSEKTTSGTRIHFHSRVGQLFFKGIYLLFAYRFIFSFALCKCDAFVFFGGTRCAIQTDKNETHRMHETLCEFRTLCTGLHSVIIIIITLLVILWIFKRKHFCFFSLASNEEVNTEKNAGRIELTK